MCNSFPPCFWPFFLILVLISLMSDYPIFRREILTFCWREILNFFPMSIDSKITVTSTLFTYCQPKYWSWYVYGWEWRWGSAFLLSVFTYVGTISNLSFFIRQKVSLFCWELYYLLQGELDHLCDCVACLTRVINGFYIRSFILSLPWCHVY